MVKSVICIYIPTEKTRYKTMIMLWIQIDWLYSNGEIIQLNSKIIYNAWVVGFVYLLNHKLHVTIKMIIQIATIMLKY